MHLQRAAGWIGRTNSARALADWKRVRRLMQDQPRSRSNDQLRALVGGQLLSFGWREGMTAEEAKLYAEEALGFAREAGDRQHELSLLGAYGRVLAAGGGKADDYVRLVREAQRLPKVGADPESDLLLNGLLCQACSRAGLFRDALGANDAGLAAVDTPGNANTGAVLGHSLEQRVGFNVAHWVRCLRAYPLVALGRLEEAELWLARLMQIEDDRIEPIIQLSRTSRGRTGLASRRVGRRQMARYRGCSLRRTIGNPVCFQSSLPLSRHLASLVDGDFAAPNTFPGRIRNRPPARRGLDYEARLLAWLAHTYVRAGDMARAIQISALKRGKPRAGAPIVTRNVDAAIAGAMAFGPPWAGPTGPPKPRIA